MLISNRGVFGGLELGVGLAGIHVAFLEVVNAAAITGLLGCVVIEVVR